MGDAVQSPLFMSASPVQTGLGSVLGSVSGHESVRAQSSLVWNSLFEASLLSDVHSSAEVKEVLYLLTDLLTYFNTYWFEC